MTAMDVPPLDPAVVPILIDPRAMEREIEALHREYAATRAAGRVLHLYPIREKLIIMEGLFCLALSPEARGEA